MAKNFTIFFIQPVKRSTYDILFFPKNEGKVIKKKTSHITKVNWW